MKKRLLLLGVTLIAGCASSLNPEPQPIADDEYIGTAAFDVKLSTDEKVWLSPLGHITLGVVKTAGSKESSGNLPPGYALCKVYKRVFEQDEAKKALIIITVLKCGEYEYGLSDVLFDVKDK